MHLDLIKRFLDHRKAVAGLLFVVQWGLLTYNMWLGDGGLGFQTIDLVVNIVIIICAVLFMQCLLLYISYQKKRSEKEILEASRELMQDHIEEIQEFYNRSRMEMHDMKHLMLYIAGCLEKKDIESVQNVVCNYIQGANESGAKVWTGFPFLDFLLNYKKQEMDKAGIAFKVESDIVEYPFEEAELGVVLGNLLDNAIEASRICAEGNRSIGLKMYNNNHTFYLDIRNTLTKMPEVVKGKFMTTKSNRERHGLGIESVRSIVQKYNGRMDVRYDKESFRVTILI